MLEAVGYPAKSLRDKQWHCIFWRTLACYAPDLIGWSTDGRRLSVCHVPDPKSRTEGYSKLKIGGKEAHDTGDS